MAKGDISWPADAEIVAKKILALHAKQLREEAEHAAERSASTAVSPTYVADAATHLRLGQKPSKGAEVMTAVGGLIIGLSGGALINAEQAGGPLVMDVAVSGYILAGAVGLVFASAGYALKLRR